MNEHPACRICGDSELPLFHPCKCTGSIQFVHESCLVRWLVVKNGVSRQEGLEDDGVLDVSRIAGLHCELCRHAFAFSKELAKPLRGKMRVVLALDVARDTLSVLWRWTQFARTVFLWTLVVPLLCGFFASTVLRGLNVPFYSQCSLAKLYGLGMLATVLGSRVGQGALKSGLYGIGLLLSGILVPLVIGMQIGGKDGAWTRGTLVCTVVLLAAAAGRRVHALGWTPTFVGAVKKVRVLTKLSQAQLVPLTAGYVMSRMVLVPVQGVTGIYLTGLAFYAPLILVQGPRKLPPLAQTLWHTLWVLVLLVCGVVPSVFVFGRPSGFPVWELLLPPLLLLIIPQGRLSSPKLILLSVLWTFVCWALPALVTRREDQVTAFSVAGLVLTVAYLIPRTPRLQSPNLPRAILLPTSLGIFFELTVVSPVLGRVPRLDSVLAIWAQGVVIFGLLLVIGVSTPNVIRITGLYAILPFTAALLLCPSIAPYTPCIFSLGRLVLPALTRFLKRQAELALHRRNLATTRLVNFQHFQ